MARVVAGRGCGSQPNGLDTTQRLHEVHRSTRGEIRDAIVRSHGAATVEMVAATIGDQVG
uniref:Uncharacterized protein n=1 Tax=Pristionchus pacificus TaxID=54126 RepID=A0A2A6BUC2_PRIPA|eukprot:PDM65142.1 hypothetical protein PRIPAC_53391 [Pristionchus pacificus]